VKPKILFRAVRQDDIPWFAQVTGYFPTSQFGGVVAHDETGTIMGMVGLDSWSPNGVQAHFAIPRPRCLIPLWDEVVNYLAKYDKAVILGVTPGDNERALRVTRRLGWKELFRVKDGWSDGVDLVVSEFRINGKIST